MELFEKFLWLQAFLVLFGVIYLLKRNRPKGAQFRWRPQAERIAPREMRRTPEQWDSQAPPESAPEEARSLNVHFNYNGHTWDAFEALGLPAGSSKEKVEEAYQMAVSTSAEGSREFYDHARQAILQKK